MGKAIGPLLREARERADLTQSELARRAGLAPNVISRLESGAREQPQFETIARIASVIGVSLDALAAGLGHLTRSGTQNQRDSVDRVRLATSVARARKALAALDDALADLESQLQPGRRLPAPRDGRRPR